MLSEPVPRGPRAVHGPGPRTPYDPGVNPGLIALFLVAALVALLPVWRLRAAGWPRGVLVTAWLLYAFGIFLAVRFPAGFRLLLPILVVAFVAPFIVGPERLNRILRRPPPTPPKVKDVTPPPPPALPGGDEGPRGSDRRTRGPGPKP
jgi:hypothetical protein